MDNLTLGRIEFFAGILVLISALLNVYDIYMLVNESALVLSFYIVLGAISSFAIALVFILDGLKKTD